eukprot:7235826-Prymnesium_polylepis.2
MRVTRKDGRRERTGADGRRRKTEDGTDGRPRPHGRRRKTVNINEVNHHPDSYYNPTPPSLRKCDGGAAASLTNLTVWGLPGVLLLSGCCLSLSGRCLGVVWGTHMVFGESCCLAVWLLSGCCLVAVWPLSGRCLKGRSRVPLSRA